MADANRVTVDLTTGIGTLSFPHVFTSTAVKKKDGSLSYETQLIIPKTQKDDARAILAAVKEVGEAKWGDKWRQVRTPLRDGDKEKDELTEDGSTKGEKYPERLGCYFINARATRPIGVVDRQRVPIETPDAIYGGCKAKIAVTFYPYSKEGNHGVGVALNGVQKIADGESFGGGAPPVESMFEMLDEDDDADLLGGDDEPAQETAKSAKSSKKGKGKGKAKADPEPSGEEDDLYDDL